MKGKERKQRGGEEELYSLKHMPRVSTPGAVTGRHHDKAREQAGISKFCCSFIFSRRVSRHSTTLVRHYDVMVVAIGA